MYEQIVNDNKECSNENTNSFKFVEGCGTGTIKCHGRVTEIDHHDVFYSKLRKTINSLFRGEPYQFGHQTSEYVIRVEELDGGFTAQNMDFFLFGNYMGRIHPGDEVILTASVSGGRNIVKTLYNAVTNSDIKPSLQLPATFIRVMFILIALMVLFGISCIHSMVVSGQIYHFVLPIGLIMAAAITMRRIKRRIFKKIF